MDSKPRILIHSHDSYGLGHLRRTLALARAFVEHDPGLGVLILTGSTVSGAFWMPQGIDIVKLPSAVKVSNRVYKPGRLPVTFERLRKLRSGLMLSAAETFNPHTFIVDKTPLGMKREVARTLEYFHTERPSTLTVLGLRDVLDDPDRVRLESLREPVPSFESIVVTGPLMDEESKRTLERQSWGLRTRVLEFRAYMECLIERAGAVVAMGGRPPGLGPLRHHHQGEHRLRQAGRHHGGNYPGRQSSQRPRLHNGARRWVRDRHR